MNATAAFVDGLRPEVQSLPAYNSGLSAEFVRARYGVAEVAKLGSNENPWGAGKHTLAAIAESVSGSALYPDPSSTELRHALSARLGVNPERLIFGNGSEDLIAVCAHSFLGPGDDMVTITPSFGLHVIYSQAIGARVQLVPVGRDYGLSMPELVAALNSRTRLVMFSSPSNPLGTAITADDIRLLTKSLGSGTLLVFDEAYFEYAAAQPDYPDFLEILEKSDTAWILLRTFSKAYGLAGLRVGYGVASDASLVHIVDRARTPFNVNRMAQAGALAALDEFAHVRDCVSRTIEERERVRQALSELGYTCSPSVANFLFFDAREDSAALAERLLHYGVIVKPWREPQYTGHIRVSIGLPRANNQFLDALSSEGKRSAHVQR